MMDSLRLIVQSQMILAELQGNQKRLEHLLDKLERNITDGEPC